MTTGPDHNAVFTLAVRRRAIFNRVAARLEARGTPIDMNPEFLAMVERWINADIGMADLTTGYAEIRLAARGKRSPDKPPKDESAKPQNSGTIEQMPQVSHRSYQA